MRTGNCGSVSSRSCAVLTFSRFTSSFTTSYYHARHRAAEPSAREQSVRCLKEKIMGGVEGR